MLMCRVRFFALIFFSFLPVAGMAAQTCYVSSKDINIQKGIIEENPGPYKSLYPYQIKLLIYNNSDCALWSLTLKAITYAEKNNRETITDEEKLYLYDIEPRGSQELAYKISASGFIYHYPLEKLRVTVAVENIKTLEPGESYINAWVGDGLVVLKNPPPAQWNFVKSTPTRWPALFDFLAVRIVNMKDADGRPITLGNLHKIPDDLKTEVINGVSQHFGKEKY